MLRNVHCVQAYHRLAKEYHPDKNMEEGHKVWFVKLKLLFLVFVAFHLASIMQYGS